MSLYLDPSVIVPTLVQEKSTGAVLALLAATTDDLLVSEYAAAEVASALSRLVRTRDLADDAARSRLIRFDAWLEAAASIVEIENLDIRNAATLVRRFELKLRTPDALHLAVCLRTRARMVTGDGMLSAAAVAIGAEVIKP